MKYNNILFVLDQKSEHTQGGVERVTKILSDHFESKGLSIFYLYTKNINKKRKLNSELFLPNKKILSHQNKLILKEFIRANKIQYIINQLGFKPTITNLFISIDLKFKLISFLHSSPNFEIKFSKIFLSQHNSFINTFKLLIKPLILFKQKNRLRKDLKYIYYNSDKVILLSNNFIEDFVRLTKIHNYDKLLYLPNPNNPKFNFDKGDISKKKNKILYVGRIQYGKRVDLILKFWKKIYHQFPDWEIIIVGDGPQLNKLRSIVSKSNLDSIKFTGHSDNVEKFYKDSSIFISLSAFEGFPTVLSEAACFGLVPLVYNTYNSVEELIVNGKTGFIIEDLDEKDLIDKIKTLINDRNLRNKMAINNYNYFKKFEVNEIFRDWKNKIFNL